jgi:hypothetical protein
MKIQQITEAYIYNLELLNGYTQSVSKDRQVFIETLDKSVVSNSNINAMYLCPSPAENLFEKAADCSQTGNALPAGVSVIQVTTEPDHSALPVYDAELPEEPLRLPLKAVPLGRN